jgi:hypothetical protein
MDVKDAIMYLRERGARFSIVGDRVDISVSKEILPKEILEEIGAPMPEFRAPIIDLARASRNPRSRGLAAPLAAGSVEGEHRRRRSTRAAGAELSGPTNADTNEDRRQPHDVPVNRIDVGRRRRALRDADVAVLADSIREVGLITPIDVLQDGDGYRLVTGLHRLEAHRRLGRREIRAVVHNIDDVDADLVEIDEKLVRRGHRVRPVHLVRRELTYLEKAEHLRTL